MDDMDEVNKMTVLEKFFERHMADVSERLGPEKAKMYAGNMEGRIQMAASVVGLSLLFLFALILGLGNLEEDNLLYLFLASFALVILSAIHMYSIRNVDRETMGDEELSRKWKLFSLNVALDGVTCGVVGLYVMFAASNKSFGSEKEEGYQVEYDKLGMVINIPAGWSEPHWEYKSDSTAQRPRYNFRTWDSDHTMWFYVAGHSTHPTYDIMDFIPGWNLYVPKYLDKEIIDNIRVVEIDGMKVLRVIGRRTAYPDYTYVYYKALHCSSLIDYTYSFRNTRPYKEEVSRSAKIFEMIDFTEVEVPVYKQKEDKRPADWTFDDGCLDITSVGMRFMLPEEKEIRWEENSRSMYVFSTSLGEYDLQFDLTVTYTSEAADLMEFFEDFESEMASRLKNGFKVRPCVKKLEDISTMHVAGMNPDHPQDIEIRYEMIYKGARLCVEAHVPSSMNLDKELRNIEKILNSIEYY